MREIQLILHNIRSAHNVGAILRTADAVTVSHVYLTGYTPGPIDRFGRKRPDIAKASLGAEETVKWTHIDDVHLCIADLKKDGVQVVAVEQDTSSVPYTSFKPEERIAIVMGAEVEGLPHEVLAVCDGVVELPMCGTKESLNVSVAAGIVLYRFSE